MEIFLTELISKATDFMGSLGFISGFLLIIFESMIPVLPLAVFIALNIMTFGSLFGFILSWVATVTGCMISFYLCRKLRDKFEKKYGNNEKVKKFKKYINKLSYSNLVILIALPFTPAFAVNIAAGLTDIDAKKYFSALMIGKLPMVYFWGFIGKSLLESITDPYTIAQVVFMVLIAYLVSRLANKFIK
jgi:uncharacterized membrane protein YdjX (TVP38/TMEM64 family)